MAPRQQSQANSISSDRSASFQIRGASFTVLTLRLAQPRDPEFFAQLAETVALAPGFYRRAPIVLDLSALGRQSPIDLAEFCARLQDLELMPVGFHGASVAWQQAALDAGLSEFPSGRAADPASVPSRSAPPPPRPARIVADPVRSGQQVYAPQGDLVVNAPVSRGAELLADGHIHVYGPLRGRALAGMGGDPAARIFCKSFDAELVSIAGTYMVSDQMDTGLIGKPVQIRRVGEKLLFEPL